MKTIEETTINRTGWPSGEWDCEPDKRQWIDEATGFPCLIVRTEHRGHLCGYVGVPPGHPWFEKDGFKDVDAYVHGGLTYSAHCAGRICHKVEPGEPDNVWWLGFDCAHCYDLSPVAYMDSDRWAPDMRYRDWSYVKSECESLARQAKAALAATPEAGEVGK